MQTSAPGLLHVAPVGITPPPFLVAPVLALVGPALVPLQPPPWPSLPTFPPLRPPTATRHTPPHARRDVATVSKEWRMRISSWVPAAGGGRRWMEGPRAFFERFVSPVESSALSRLPGLRYPRAA